MRFKKITETVQVLQDKVEEMKVKQEGDRGELQPILGKLFADVMDKNKSKRLLLRWIY